MKPNLLALSIVGILSMAQIPSVYAESVVESKRNCLNNLEACLFTAGTQGGMKAYIQSQKALLEKNGAIVLNIAMIAACEKIAIPTSNDIPVAGLVDADGNTVIKIAMEVVDVSALNMANLTLDMCQVTENNPYIYQAVNVRGSGVATTTTTLTTERDGLAANKAALTTERDALVVERDGLMVDKNSLITERDALVVVRDGLMVNKSNLTTERDTLTTERNALLIDKSNLTTERDTLTTERDGLLGDKSSLTTERDALLLDKTGLTTKRDSLQTQNTCLIEGLAAMLLSQQSAATLTAVQEIENLQTACLSQ